MGRIKKGFVKEIKQVKEVEEKQEKLKSKYQVVEDVIVVEKNNTFKFTISFLSTLIRVFATILLLTLAAIGTCTLLYPDLRAGFYVILQELYRQVL